MRLSARNVFRGKITKVVMDATTAHVVAAISSAGEGEDSARTGAKAGKLQSALYTASG